LHFFSCFLEPIQKLIKIFQKDTLDCGEMICSLEVCLTQLKEMLGSAFAGTKLNKFIFSASEKIAEYDGIKILYLDEKDTNEFIIQKINEYSKTIVENIEIRLENKKILNDL
jgi:hypothetical protein